MIEIDQATKSDLPDLLTLNAGIQAHHVALSPDDFHANIDPEQVRQLFLRQMDDPPQVILLAREDADPVGYVWYEMLDAHEGTFTRSGRRVYVHHIGVAASHRRQGIARRLMNRVIADAGRREIGLSSFAANTDAHAFFESLGFEPFRITFRKTGALDR